jgi:hypothetical protein
MASVRPNPLSSAWRFLAWWFSGLADGRTWFPGFRLLAVGVALGLLVGWSYGRVMRVVTVEETSLPKPVTAPPRARPGCMC